MEIKILKCFGLILFILAIYVMAGQSYVFLDTADTNG